MEIQFKRFSMPKNASMFKEYQDATYSAGPDYAIPYFEFSEDQDEFRCALADGATDTVFSKRWAELLMSGYAINEWSEKSISSQSLAGLRERWESHVAVKELPWYTLEKAKRGAAAALVSLRISDVGRRWSGVAIGDSCLFHIRNRTVIARLPEFSASDFSNVVSLVSTNNESIDDDFEQLKHLRDKDNWLPGDRFYLMSDALASWFIKKIEDGKQFQAITLLGRFDTQLEFERFVTAERKKVSSSGARALPDDDTTLIVVEVHGSRVATARKERSQLAFEPTKIQSTRKARISPTWLMVALICFTLLACTGAAAIYGYRILNKYVNQTATINSDSELTKNKQHSKSGNEKGQSKFEATNNDVDSTRQESSQVGPRPPVIKTGTGEQPMSAAPKRAQIKSARNSKTGAHQKNTETSKNSIGVKFTR